MRAAAAAGLAAVADALEVANRQATRVETVMGAGIDVRLHQVTVDFHTLEQRLALLHRRPVVERAQGEHRGQARPWLWPQRLAQPAIGIDQDRRPPAARYTDISASRERAQ